MTVNVTIWPSAAVGARNVTVTNPDTGAATCTGCVTINAAPTLSSVSPATRARGLSSQTLTIAGTGFQPSAVVSFSGNGITVNSTLVGSTTSITVNVTIAPSADLGARSVTVTN